MEITIISLDNWGYNQFIANELETRGITVTHIDFHKFKYKYPSFFHKALNFFTKSLFNYNFKREHLTKELLKLLADQNKQDAILIIKGDNLSISTIKKIKNNTSNLIAFLNDSMSRYPRMKTVFPYFDKVYSFEPSDVSKYQLKLITNYIYFDYKSIPKTKPVFGVFNISSLDKRKVTMPNFARFFKEKQIDYKLIAFSKEPNDELTKLGIELTTQKYSLDDVFKLVSQSEILLDLQRPKQKGLSFRIMEAIALEKKLISTNKDLVNYDFYNPNNIAIVDSDAIKIDNQFFKTPYEAIAPEIINKYHISSWVNEVFNL